MDRNSKVNTRRSVKMKSLSARRAWIEIPAGCWRDARRASLSARRAWIEIVLWGRLDVFGWVALRKESVDRNVPFDVIRPAIDGRSPQGERG